jgi:isocitrate dehydrogenase kinase/phosphatase
VFCTHRLFGSGRAMGIMEKMLDCKGYETVLKVVKKGMKPDKQTDFSAILSEVKTVKSKPNCRLPTGSPCQRANPDFLGKASLR